MKTYRVLKPFWRHGTSTIVGATFRDDPQAGKVLNWLAEACIEEVLPDRSPRPEMVERSMALQKILRDAGFVKRNGSVSTLGIALVTRLAKARGLRGWADTRTVEDYDALATVLHAELVRLGRRKHLGGSIAAGGAA